MGKKILFPLYQNYLTNQNGFSNKSVIVSDETNPGESWRCIITPNNSLDDDIAITTDPIIIDNDGGD